MKNIKRSLLLLLCTLCFVSLTGFSNQIETLNVTYKIFNGFKNTKNIEVKVLNGKAPYSFGVINKSENQGKNTQSNSIVFENLVSGEYLLIVTDSDNNIYTANLSF